MDMVHVRCVPDVFVAVAVRGSQKPKGALRVWIGIVFVELAVRLFDFSVQQDEREPPVIDKVLDHLPVRFEIEVGRYPALFHKPWPCLGLVDAPGSVERQVGLRAVLVASC